MKKIILLALVLVTMLTGRALAQHAGCDCTQCLATIEAAEQAAEQVKLVAADQAVAAREAKEAELLGQWSRLTAARERLAKLDAEVARLENEVARLAGQFETSTEPTPTSQVVAPVRNTAPVLPQCGSGCASELRETFQTNAPAQEGCGGCDGAATQVKEEAKACGSGCDGAATQVKQETKACGSSCDGAAATQVKKDEGCGSCGGCDAAATQVKQEAKACGSCSGCEGAAATQVKKDEGCGSCGSCDAAATQVKQEAKACGSCSGCEGAAATQVKKDEGCGSCGSCDAAATQVVKAYDTRGTALECCPQSTAKKLSCCELEHALAMARTRVARTEAAIVGSTVKVRALKTEVAMGKLGVRVDPATQQVKALGAQPNDCSAGTCGDCGCGMNEVKAEVKAKADCSDCTNCADCPDCVDCTDCTDCGCCPAAAATEVKKEEGCGGCEKAAATQVKKEEAGACGGCNSGCSEAPKS